MTGSEQGQPDILPPPSSPEPPLVRVGPLKFGPSDRQPSHPAAADSLPGAAIRPEPPPPQPVTFAPYETPMAALFRRWRDLLHHGLPPNSPLAYILAVACIALATLVRVTLGYLAGGDVVPFSTYYPAVLIAAIIGGSASGLLAMALGGVMGWWAFMPNQFSFVVSDRPQAITLAIYFLASLLIIAVAEGYRRAYRRLDEEQEKRLLLMNELQHRGRNVSAVVQSIIKQSLRDDPERAGKINNRIQALTATDELLTKSDMQSLEIKEILRAELRPYEEARVHLQGDAFRLDASHARTLALAFHELATNAAKYGALSKPEGRLSVSWRREDGIVVIDWREENGPVVVPPSANGFGTSFTRRLLQSLEGSVTTDFHRDGLRCRISFPLNDTPHA